MAINPDAAWVEGLHEVCTSCDKNFWADTHNDREQGWFCDKCLEHPEDKIRRDHIEKNST